MRNKPFFFSGILLLTFPYVVWLYMGKNSFVVYHDNLDSTFVYVQMLLRSGHLFDFSLEGTIPEIMNGLPRYFFRGGLNVSFLVFSILPPFSGYVAHHFLVHLTGFLGMWLLLNRYIVPNKSYLVFTLSLGFAFLSYYHIQSGISVSGQPLLLWAFLNLLHHRLISRSWAVIISFPFFSFLPVTLPFFIPYLFLLGFWFFKKESRFPAMYFCAMGCLCLLNVLIEYPLFFSMINSEFVSHRSEWNKLAIHGGPPGIREMLFTTIKELSITHYHCGRLITIPIWGLVGLSLIRQKNRTMIGCIAGILVFNALWVSAYDWLVYFTKDHIGFFSTFNGKRFYFLNPFLWFLLLGTGLSNLDFSPTKNTIIRGFVLTPVLGSILYFNPEGVRNTQILLSKKPLDEPTFSQYFDNSIFPNIKHKLEQSSTEEHPKVLCVGFSPSIAQFFGMHTLDAYQNNYPLVYKQAFRTIIASELEKSPQLKSYFDHWGSRCYAFSSELGKKYLVGKQEPPVHLSLDYDWDAFITLGGTHLLSAIRLDPKPRSRLRYIASYTSPDSFWKIHVYRVRK